MILPDLCPQFRKLHWGLCTDNSAGVKNNYTLQNFGAISKIEMDNFSLDFTIRISTIFISLLICIFFTSYPQITLQNSGGVKITALRKTSESFPKSKWITLVLVLQLASALFLSHLLSASSSCLILKSFCKTPEEFTVHNPRIHPGEWKSRKTKLRRSFPKSKQIPFIPIYTIFAQDGSQFLIEVNGFVMFLLIFYVIHNHVLIPNTIGQRTRTLCPMVKGWKFT